MCVCVFGGGGGYGEHVGKMTDTCKQKAEEASEILIKRSLFVGEHADQIIGPPSW